MSRGQMDRVACDLCGTYAYVNPETMPPFWKKIEITIHRDLPGKTTVEKHLCSNCYDQVVDKIKEEL